MASELRGYFIGFYAIGAAVLVMVALTSLGRGEAVEKRPAGLRAYLPVLAPLNWFAPPLLMASGIGELPFDWPLVRLTGFTASFYALAMLLWAPSALGRFLVPRAVIFRDHELVTSGPYRFVRHPIYSGVVTLWLAAGLGTLNVVLLGLWPLITYAFSIQAGIEEGLLGSKFGSSYEDYVASTGRLAPRLLA
jgi:protein-S-isoprenylcysteine O-methyltransferase Ste14